MMRTFAMGVAGATVVALGLVIVVAEDREPAGHAAMAGTAPFAADPHPYGVMRDTAALRVSLRALRDDLDVYINDGDEGHVADINGEPSGYASFVLIKDETAAELYWHGPVPAAVTEIIAAHSAAEIEIYPAAWSLAELMQGCAEAAELLKSDEFAGLDYQGVGPQPDASGLHIALGDVTNADAVLVKSAVERATGIDVLVETGVHIDFLIAFA